MNTTDPRARLLDLASDKGVSLSALSALIGRNTTYLQQFVKKGSPRKLEEGDRRTLARFFGVDESELGGAEENSSILSGAAPSPWVDIPRLALDASAGPGAVAGDEAPFGHLRYARDWLRRQGFDPAQLSVIAVAGDSMADTLFDGDEILVDRSAGAMGRRWRDGVHVVRVGDQLLVKRLSFERPGQVRVISDNRSYDAYDLPLDEVSVIGRVVWKSGRV